MCGAALLFSALYRIPGFQLGQVSDLAFGFFCGFGLTHYYLDSRIWRVRHDPGLREALHLAVVMNPTEPRPSVRDDARDGADPLPRPAPRRLKA